MQLKRKLGLVALTAAAVITAQTIAAQTLDKFIYMPAISMPARETAVPTPTSTVEATATPTATSTPPGATQTATATTAPPLATPTPTQPAPVGANVVCSTVSGYEACAWVSNGNPARGSDVTVFSRLIYFGSPLSGQSMQSTWHYKSSTPSCNTGVTGVDGTASCTRDIGSATSGFQVNVDVVVGGYAVTTFFTPQ